MMQMIKRRICFSSATSSCLFCLHLELISCFALLQAPFGLGPSIQMVALVALKIFVLLQRIQQLV